MRICPQEGDNGWKRPLIPHMHEHSRQRHDQLLGPRHMTFVDCNCTHRQERQQARLVRCAGCHCMRRLGQRGLLGQHFIAGQRIGQGHLTNIDRTFNHSENVCFMNDRDCKHPNYDLQEGLATNTDRPPLPLEERLLHERQRLQVQPLHDLQEGWALFRILCARLVGKQADSATQTGWCILHGPT